MAAGKVFISYRRDDSAGHAGRLHDRLQRELGHDLLFMDVDTIPLGVNFVKVISEEVAKCDVLLAVIGQGWLGARDENGERRLDNGDDFVRIEIGTALKRGIPVIPILLDGTRIPKADQLPDDLKELALRNGLDVRHASFSQDMEWLIRGLKGAQSPQALASIISSLADPKAVSRNVKVWNFLSYDKNRAILGWLGGGVGAVVGAFWVAFVYFAPPPKPVVPASVEAKSGGVAIGGNVSGSTITTVTPDVATPAVANTGWMYVGTRVDDQWKVTSDEGIEPALTLRTAGIPVSGQVYETITSVHLRANLPEQQADGTRPKMPNRIGSVNSGTLVKVDSVRQIKIQNPDRTWIWAHVTRLD